MAQKIILFFIFSILFACGEKNYKYKKGDVVYLKPDSTKYIITGCYKISDGYRISNNQSWIPRDCIESDIYGKEESKSSK